MSLKRISLEIDGNVIALEFARVYVNQCQQRVFWVMSFIVHVFSEWLLRVKVHFFLVDALTALLYSLA